VLEAAAYQYSQQYYKKGDRIGRLFGVMNPIL
jgi:hypothetical protein